MSAVNYCVNNWKPLIVQISRETSDHDLIDNRYVRLRSTITVREQFI